MITAINYCFPALEKINGSYISDDLRERQDDIIWRLRREKGETGEWQECCMVSEPASYLGFVVPVGLSESGFEVGFFMTDDAITQHCPDQRCEEQRPPGRQQHRDPDENQPVTEINRIAAVAERSDSAQTGGCFVGVDGGSVAPKRNGCPYQQCQPCDYP